MINLFTLGSRAKDAKFAKVGLIGSWFLNFAGVANFARDPNLPGERMDPRVRKGYELRVTTGYLACACLPATQWLACLGSLADRQACP